MNKKYNFNSSTKFKEIIMSDLTDRAQNKMMDYKKQIAKTIFKVKKDVKETD